MKALRMDVRKTVATVVVAGFFIFFWVHGPLTQVIEIPLAASEDSETVKPVLVGDSEKEQSSFQTVDEMETRGEGFALILDEVDSLTSYSLLEDDAAQVLSTEYGDELLENARHHFGKEADFSLQQSEQSYYALIEAAGVRYFYFQSKGLTDEIKGYSGPINVGIFVREDGYLHKMVHVSSIETESYLEKIARTHYYKQYDDLPMDRLHELDGISGATISSKAMARTTTELVHFLYPHPLDDLVEQSRLNDFETEAQLNWLWIPYILLVGILFLYALQKKFRKSKRNVLIAALASALFIGFFLNESFTYVTFMHPFIGTSLSSFMGIYALFVLLGAIWGKNTYCKYICPYGNIQRLQLKLWGGTKSKFPLSNKWIKRIRFGVLIFLIAGILAGFRNLSHLEPYPYVFGFEYQSLWYFSFAIAALLLNWVYPMIWCRLLCPTGSILDSLSCVVERSKKKKP